VQALAHAVLRGVGLVRRVIRARPIATTALAASSLAFFLSACALGPNYTPAAAPVPAKFKELKGWKLARPSDALDRGDWWNVYRDKRLAVLMRQVEISNQNVAVQAAVYEQARALIREAQASLFPMLTGTYTATRSRRGPNVSGGGGSGFGGGGGGGGGTYSTTYEPALNGSWDLDVWGKIRRQIESNTAAAQASAADLANVKLSQQALLATAYFNLRATDALHDLLARTVAEYKRTLQIVQNQYNAGYSVTSGDVATAQAQVESAQAQEINSGVLRAQYEHAIAMLTGEAGVVAIGGVMAYLHYPVSLFYSDQLQAPISVLFFVLPLLFAAGAVATRCDKAVQESFRPHAQQQQATYNVGHARDEAEQQDYPEWCRNLRHDLAIRCDECASRHHPAQCSPCLRGAACHATAPRLQSLLRAGYPSGWFRRE